MTVMLTARVLCCVCGAMPFPCCEKVEASFDVRRLGLDGRPSESPRPGLWFCGAHRPTANKPASNQPTRKNRRFAKSKAPSEPLDTDQPLARAHEQPIDGAA